MALVLRKPLEKQQQRVDLVVVAAARKGEQLLLEIGEPRGLPWQQDAAGFEAALLAAHAGFFVGVRLAADDVEPGLFPQQLDQPHAAAGILDDDEIGLPLPGECDNLLAHLHHGPMPAADMQKMERLLLDADNRNRGVIVMSAGLAGRIATQDDPLETAALGGSI